MYIIFTCQKHFTGFLLFIVKRDNIYKDLSEIKKQDAVLKPILSKTNEYNSWMMRILIGDNFDASGTSMYSICCGIFETIVLSKTSRGYIRVVKLKIQYLS